jgi:LPS O-antigen subunit length determinant protein (WzzB/FepE family)
MSGNISKLRELSYHQKRDLELQEFYKKSEAFQEIFDNFSFEDMTLQEVEAMQPKREKYKYISEAEMQTIYMGHLTGLFKSLKDIGVI